MMMSMMMIVNFWVVVRGLAERTSRHALRDFAAHASIASFDMRRRSSYTFKQ